ncbi:MAG: OmpA family protein [candidate division KSB1 bacterium]|nr:OmpA family protein [candidate division KSB1 bacterium]MDZ7301060.1 OmpA family protein [candidate division KSB1 bacterium]MDZ7312116.1 OmpA family protein [candidate division KSB1 bacterium]
MKAFMIFLAILTLVLAALAGYYFNRDHLARQELQKLDNEKTELAGRVQSLESQVAELSRQLQEEIAKVSKQKEEEISRLASAHEELVKELQQEIQNKEIQITQLADRLSVSMVDKILFPSGEAEITPAGLKVLERVGNIIKNVQDKIIRVEGHTDNVPIALRLQKQFPTNWELSTARATNVVRFLQDKVGMDPARLQAVGLSEYHPVASNETPQGRSKNRRIEIALLPMAGVPQTTVK